MNPIPSSTLCLRSPTPCCRTKMDGTKAVPVLCNKVSTAALPAVSGNRKKVSSLKDTLSLTAQGENLYNLIREGRGAGDPLQWYLHPCTAISTAHKIIGRVKESTTMSVSTSTSNKEEKRKKAVFILLTKGMHRRPHIREKERCFSHVRQWRRHRHLRLCSWRLCSRRRGRLPLAEEWL